MSKKFLLLLAFALLMLAFAIPVRAGAPAVNLDGKALTFEVPPVVEEGRTLVPLRAIFEALGTTVTWDEPTQTVMANKGDVAIKLVIGGKAYKNDAEVQLDVPARIVDGRTLVPLRFISESLGAKVDWIEETETINITSAPDEPATPTAAALSPFETYLNTIPDRFNPESAKGVSIIIQYNITSGHPGLYWVKISDGECTVGKGEQKNADLVINTGEKLWMDIVSGKVDRTSAYYSGKFTVEGNVNNFAKLKEWIK